MWRNVQVTLIDPWLDCKMLANTQMYVIHAVAFVPANLLSYTFPFQSISVLISY